MTGVGAAAIFLDRDGVLNDPVPRRPGGPAEAPHDPDDVRLAVGAVDGLRALRRQGYVLLVVSNQPGAAKAEVSAETLEAVHRRVAALLAEHGVDVDDWSYCHHHPDAVVAELRGPCDCRKPEPGLLLRAAAAHGVDLGRSWMVGDTDADLGAGRAAGVRTVLIEHPASAHRRTAVHPSSGPPDVAGDSGRPSAAAEPGTPDLRAPDLAAAALLLARASR